MRAGRGRGAGGAGGGWKFLVTEKKILAKTSFFLSLLNFFFKNVPGVLKCMHNFFRGGGGGDFGVFGAPHAPTRGSHGVGKRYTSSYDHDMVDKDTTEL